MMHCQTTATSKMKIFLFSSIEISHKIILDTFYPQAEWLVFEGNVNKQIGRSQAPPLVILKKEFCPELSGIDQH